jgi:hypothetical protein
MDFIWDTLKAKGRINRADLMSQYDISEAQASKDFRDFLGLYPTAMAYDKREKAYISTIGKQKAIN